MDQILSLKVIRQRKAELTRTANEARESLHAANVGLAQLEEAEKLVAKFGMEIDDAEALTVEKANANRVAAPVDTKPKLNTRDLVLSVMRLMTSVWTNANEVQARASEIKGEEIPMSTISPTLSKLKGEELIVRSGMRIALAERLKEIEPSTGVSGDGSGGDVAERSNAPDS